MFQKPSEGANVNAIATFILIQKVETWHRGYITPEAYYRWKHWKYTNIEQPGLHTNLWSLKWSKKLGITDIRNKLGYRWIFLPWNFLLVSSSSVKPSYYFRSAPNAMFPILIYSSVVPSLGIYISKLSHYQEAFGEHDYVNVSFYLYN